MEKKKILIISRGFYPAQSPRAFRTTELVRELAKQKHDVTLYTLKDDKFHVPFEVEHGIRIKDLGRLKFRALNIRGSNKIASLFKRAVNRILSLLFEFPDIEVMFKIKKALRFEQGYDLLISIAFPHPVHWGVALARSVEHPIAKTWVADCGDPYMGERTDSFRKLFYFKYIEKWFCRKADYLSVPTEGSVSAYYPEFRSKIRVIPQGVNFDDVKLLEGEVKNLVPTFAYAGQFIPGRRDPEELFNFLIGLEVDFKFIIYAPLKDQIKRYVDASRERIVWHPYIPRKELLCVLGKMDFLVNFDNNTPTATPSKLIDYALVKRPILNIMASLNTQVIEEFLRGDYTHQYIVRNVEQYDIRRVAGQFLELSG